MQSNEVFQNQPPHPVTAPEQQFLDSREERERALHTLAQQMLGSSYFTGKTHGFTQWLKTKGSRPTQASQSQATK